MVDPNRKINRLSDDDAAFLRECEQEFRNRFTDGDTEYSAFCAKETRPPPITDPWQENRRPNYGGRGGGGRPAGSSGGNNHWRNNSRNSSGSGGRRHHQNNYTSHNHRPYDRSDRRYDGNGGDRGGSTSYTHRPY